MRWRGSSGDEPDELLDESNTTPAADLRAGRAPKALQWKQQKSNSTDLGRIQAVPYVDSKYNTFNNVAGDQCNYNITINNYPHPLEDSTTQPVVSWS